MIKTVSQIGPASAGRERTGDPEIDRRIAMHEAWESNRDQWERPKVAAPDGLRERGYRRASSYGAPLEDNTQLIKWKMREVARGIARRSSLSLAVTRAEVGLAGEAEERKRAKRELDGICKQALEAVGAGDKASIGTSLHHVCELLDLGRDPGHIPEQWQPDVDAYRQLTAGFAMVSVERIVVQDEHRVAGTLDRAVRLTRPLITPTGQWLDAGEVLIGDVKTAQSMDFAGAKFGVQCWVYATGVPYDPVTKRREEWGHPPPRTDWALIFHVPSGQGEAALYWVDLTDAGAAAEVVRAVYDWRGRRGKRLITPGRANVEDFTAACEHATDLDELMRAYRRAVAAGRWDEVLKARFSRRRRELEKAVGA